MSLKELFLYEIPIRNLILHLKHVSCTCTYLLCMFCFTCRFTNFCTSVSIYFKTPFQRCCRQLFLAYPWRAPLASSIPFYILLDVICKSVYVWGTFAYIRYRDNHVLTTLVGTRNFQRKKEHIISTTELQPNWVN